MFEQHASDMTRLQEEMSKAQDDEQAKVAFFLENTNQQVLMSVLKNMQPQQHGQWKPMHNFTASTNS